MYQEHLSHPWPPLFPSAGRVILRNSIQGSNFNENSASHIVKQIKENMQMGNSNCINELFHQLKITLRTPTQNDPSNYHYESHNKSNNPNEMLGKIQNNPNFTNSDYKVTWTTNTITSSNEIPVNEYYQSPNWASFQHQNCLPNTSQKISYASNNITKNAPIKGNHFLHPPSQNFSQGPTNILNIDETFTQDKNIPLNGSVKETPVETDETFSKIMKIWSENFITKFDQTENNDNREQDNVSNSTPPTQNTSLKDCCIILIEDDDNYDIQTKILRHVAESNSIHDSDVYTLNDISFTIKSENDHFPMKIINQIQFETEIPIENQNPVITELCQTDKIKENHFFSENHFFWRAGSNHFSSTKF